MALLEELDEIWIGERAIVTASQAPLSIASSITDAVWKPPPHRTGIPTAALIARDSGRLMPSTPRRRVGRSHCHLKIRLSGHVLKTM